MDHVETGNATAGREQRVTELVKTNIQLVRLGGRQQRRIRRQGRALKLVKNSESVKNGRQKVDKAC